MRVPIEATGGGLLRPLTLAIARMVADRHPDDLTVEMRKAGRGGRTLLDWSRSMPGATLIAPWGPRASPLATVATPLAWDEVDDNLDPTVFRLGTVLDAPTRGPTTACPMPSPSLGWSRRCARPARARRRQPAGVTASYLDGEP